MDNKISNINNNINEYKSKIDNLIVRKNNINNNIVKNNRDIDSSTYKIDYLENNLNNNLSVPKQIKSILDNPKFNGIHNVISS